MCPGTAAHCGRDAGCSSACRAGPLSQRHEVCSAALHLPPIGQARRIVSHFATANNKTMQTHTVRLTPHGLAIVSKHADAADTDDAIKRQPACHRVKMIRAVYAVTPEVMPGLWSRTKGRDETVSVVGHPPLQGPMHLLLEHRCNRPHGWHQLCEVLSALNEHLRLRRHPKGCSIPMNFT